MAQMSDEETAINVEIARILGCEYDPVEQDVWLRIDGELHKFWAFTRDLNAMREAEKSLSWERWKIYTRRLADLAGFSYSEADTKEEAERDYVCRLTHATALHKAEAFLYAHGETPKPNEP
jgi:hypothetical protein